MSSLIALIVFAVIAACVYYFVIRDKYKDIKVKRPDVKRKGLKFGFYTCWGEQIAETLGFTNLHWITAWEGRDKLMADIEAARGDVVLDINWLLFDDQTGGMTLRSDDGAALRSVFDELRMRGTLSKIKVLYPRDEPNLPSTNVSALMPAAVATARLVAREYPELDGVKVGVIYFTDGKAEFDDIAIYDIVGFDFYKARSSYLAPGGLYDQMVHRLHPTQQTWLVPGAFTELHQDPEPFMNTAYTRPEVYAVIPFLWASVPWERFKGCRDIPAQREAWSAAGRDVLDNQ